MRNIFGAKYLEGSLKRVGGGPSQVLCLLSLKQTTVYNPDNDLT